MAVDQQCPADHRFHVAEVVGVESEGTVHILALCVQCGLAKQNTFQVAEAGRTLRLSSEETPNKNSKIKGN